LKEDISEKKEKIKELVKERNKFEEWSYDWTEKEEERQRVFKELNKAIKEKKQYEELDKKIQYLLKLKSNIQNIKNEITKNFQTQAKPKIKFDFKKIYKKTSSKNISQEKDEEITKKLSFEEEFSKLTNKEKLNWIISNKDKVSAKDWLKLLTKIDFTKLSESDQDKYLELQEDWEKQVKTVPKQETEKEYAKYGIFSVPVKKVAFNLEVWNTWNKEIDKKIWFLLSNIFWSYDEFLNYVEGWKIGCKIVEEFKKKYPSYKNVISEIQTFFVNNFVEYKKFKKLSFDVIKSIIEKLEKEWKGVKLSLYHFNTLLYKSRNLDEVKWALEKFGSQIKFNEATLKIILSKCEYFHQFEELRNTYFPEVELPDSFLNLVREKLVSKDTDVYFPSKIQELENINTFQEFRRRWRSLCPSFRSLNLDKYTNKDKLLNTWLKIYDALEKILTAGLFLDWKGESIVNTIIDKISQLKQDFKVSKTILEEELLIKELSKKTDRIYVKKTIENIEKANNLDEFFGAWRAYWKSIIQSYRTWTNTEKAFNTWKKIYDKLVSLVYDDIKIDGRRKRVIRTVVLNLRKLDEKFQVDDKIKKILESNKNKEKLALEKNNSSKLQKVVNVEKEIWTKQQIKKEVQSPKNQNKVSNNFKVENKVSDNKEKNIDEVLKNYYEKTWKSQKQEKKINPEDIFKNIQPKKQTSIEEIQANPDKFFQVIINNLWLWNKKWPGNKTWYKIWLERLDKYFELYENLSAEQIEKLLPKLKWWDILRLYSEGKIKLSLKLKQDIFVKILKKDHSFLIETVDYEDLLKKIFKEVTESWYEWFYVSKWWIWIEILKSLEISKQNFARKTKKFLVEFDNLFH